MLKREKKLSFREFLRGCLEAYVFLKVAMFDLVVT